MRVVVDELPDLPCAEPCNENIISWPEYIQSLFEAADIANNLTAIIQGSDTVIVKNLEYVRDVKSALENANLQPWDWANYLGFKLLQIFQVAQQNIEEEFEDNCENYLISGKRISRFGLLHGAVGSMYVRKYFNTDKKRDVEAMVDYMKEGFKECICQNPSFKWMDSETQSAALDKVNAMEGDIGYPPELVNKNVVDDYYNGRFR